MVASKNMLCARLWICRVFVPTLYLSFGAKCLLQIEGCLCFAGCCYPDTGLLPGRHLG